MQEKQQHIYTLVLKTYVQMLYMTKIAQNMKGANYTTAISVTTIKSNSKIHR